MKFKHTLFQVTGQIFSINYLWILWTESEKRTCMKVIYLGCNPKQQVRARQRWERHHSNFIGVWRLHCAEILCEADRIPYQSYPAQKMEGEHFCLKSRCLKLLSIGTVLCWLQTVPGAFTSPAYGILEIGFSQKKGKMHRVAMSMCMDSSASITEL